MLTFLIYYAAISFHALLAVQHERIQNYNATGSRPDQKTKRNATCSPLQLDYMIMLLFNSMWCRQAEHTDFRSDSGITAKIQRKFPFKNAHAKICRAKQSMFLQQCIFHIA